MKKLPASQYKKNIQQQLSWCSNYMNHKNTLISNTGQCPMSLTNLVPSAKAIDQIKPPYP